VAAEAAVAAAAAVAACTAAASGGGEGPLVILIKELAAGLCILRCRRCLLRQQLLLQLSCLVVVQHRVALAGVRQLGHLHEGKGNHRPITQHTFAYVN
jgi:hypothetical protein